MILKNHLSMIIVRINFNYLEKLYFFYYLYILNIMDNILNIISDLQKQQKLLEIKVNFLEKKIKTEQNIDPLQNIYLFCDSCNSLSISNFFCSNKICANIIKKCRPHITPEFLDNIFCDECLIKNEISDYIEHSED